MLVSRVQDKGGCGQADSPPPALGRGRGCASVQGPRQPPLPSLLTPGPPWVHKGTPLCSGPQLRMEMAGKCPSWETDECKDTECRRLCQRPVWIKNLVKRFFQNDAEGTQYIPYILRRDCSRQASYRPTSPHSVNAKKTFLHLSQ